MNRCAKCQGLLIDAYDADLRDRYVRCLNCGCDPTLPVRTGIKCRWASCQTILPTGDYCDKHQQSRQRSGLTEAERAKAYRARRNAASKRWKAKQKGHAEA